MAQNLVPEFIFINYVQIIFHKRKSLCFWNREKNITSASKLTPNNGWLFGGGETRYDITQRLPDLEALGVGRYTLLDHLQLRTTSVKHEDQIAVSLPNARHIRSVLYHDTKPKINY